MTPLRIRANAEQGSALIVSFAILLTVLIFSAATFQAATVLTNRSNKETDAQQAFQAADAGVDTAAHRLSQLSSSNSTQPLTNANCPQTVSGVITAVTPSSGVWCTTTTSEPVGSDASFTYSISTASSPTCVGTAQSTTDRCIVATGTANGLQRRLIARVTTQGGANSAVFADGSVKANDSIKVESNASLSVGSSTATPPAGMSLNTKLEVSHGATISGTIQISKSAKTPKGIASTAYTRRTDLPDPLVSTPAPDFGTTAYPYDASTNPGGNNDSTLSTTYYTAGTGSPPGTRKLTVPNNKSVTLVPGTYNFCSIEMAGRGIISTTGTSANPVKIYLDSPSRDGSNCPRNTGTIKSGAKSAFVNPSLDPTALQIFAWGSASRKKKTNLQIPMGKNGTLAAIIYAPNSEVRFADNKGLLIGGIVGRRVVFKKNMRFVSDSRVASWTTRTIRQTYRVAWKQCDSTIVNPSPPSTGC